MIPTSYTDLSVREEAAVLAALRAGHLEGNGPECRLLEAEILHFLGDKGHLLAVSSGSAALEIACRLLGEGEEVLVPAFTFVTCATSVLRAGRTLRFCDVSPETGCVTVETLEAARTPKTRAIMVVHYAGYPSDMEQISAFAAHHGLTVLEDAAHALGTRFVDGRAAGTAGDFGCFSLHASKEVPAGEGGMLWCRESHTARRAGIFREKGTNRDDWLAGRTDSYAWLELGGSDTLADPLAALARAFLPTAEMRRQQREQRAGLWREALKGIPGLLLPPEPPAGSVCNWHTYPIRVENRPHWMEGFRRAGLIAAPHFPPLHQSPWARANLPAVRLPGVEYYSASVLRLPLHSLVTPDEIQRIAEALRTWT